MTNYSLFWKIVIFGFFILGLSFLNSNLISESGQPLFSPNNEKLGHGEEQNPPAFLGAFMGDYYAGSEIKAITISGGVAYLNIGSGPVQLISITDPSTPAFLGQFNCPDSNSIAVTGSIAYVGAGNNDFRTINITNPTSPSLLGGCAPAGWALDIALNGEIAVSVNTYTGLFCINITNPKSPTVLGQYNTPGNAEGVELYGNIAYVADAGSGLQIINITNPNSPSLITSYDTPGYAYDLAISGNVAYLADGASGLLIFNISNPKGPTLIGTYNTPGNAESVRVSGNVAYVADNSSGVQCIDVSIPASPTLLATYKTEGDAKTVAINGDILYAGDTDTLYCIKISSLLTPVILNIYNPGNQQRDVVIRGDIAYSIAMTTGLTCTNISDPANPDIMGNYPLSSPYDIAICGEVAYIAEYSLGIVCINVSNPESPVLLGSNDPGDYFFGIAVSGNIAYLAANNGLYCINITNPKSPTPLGSYTCTANKVVLSGLTAYVTVRTSGLLCLNVSNPKSPTLLGSYTETDINFNRASINGQMLYVTNTGTNLGLICFNISNPSKPSLMGSYLSVGNPGDVDVFGQYIYLTESIEGLVCINMSDPYSPTKVNNLASAGTSGLDVNANIAIVANVSSGINCLKLAEYVWVTPPTLSEEDDQTWEVQSTDKNITWTPIDASTNPPNAYTIYCNESVVQTGTWNSNSPIVIDLSALDLANEKYVFECVINDGYPNGNASDSVNITVFDICPVFGVIGDFIWEANSTGHSIEWSLTDLTINITARYTVYRNDTFIKSGFWNSGDTISVDVSGMELDVNKYKFDCVVNDGYKGGNSTDSVFVTIVNYLPGLSSPDDQSWSNGTTGHTISWTPTDISTKSPTSYSIYRDGTLIDTGTWLSGEAIVINIDNLLVGLYSFQCEINDGYSGGNAFDIVQIQVVEKTAGSDDPSDEPEPSLLNYIREYWISILGGVTTLGGIISIIAFKLRNRKLFNYLKNNPYSTYTDVSTKFGKTKVEIRKILRKADKDEYIEYLDKNDSWS